MIGYCVMHLTIPRHPADPSRLRVPTPEDWRAAEDYAADRAVTWWDHNPVFACQEEAERYALLAPVETDIAVVEYVADPPDEEEGWFDSFRSPHWFRLSPEGAGGDGRGAP